MRARPNFRQREFVTTQSGIVIGRSYVEPAPIELGSEAEIVQRAFLPKRLYCPSVPTKPSPWHRLKRWIKWRVAMAKFNRAFPGSAAGRPKF